MLVVRRDADGWVWMVPEPVPAGAPVECGEDDVLVVLRGGRVHEVLEPGRHIVGAGSQVAFVRARRRLALGLPIASRLGRLRGSGEAEIRVIDAGALIEALGSDPDAAAAAERRVGQAIGRSLEARLGRAASPEELAPALAEAERELAATELPIAGIAFARLASFALKGEGGEELARYEGAAPLEAGDPVWGYWTDGWYPAAVLDQDSDQVQVQWDGADTWAWLPRDQVKPR